MDFSDKSTADAPTKVKRFLDGLQNWKSSYWFDDGWPRISVSYDALATKEYFASLERDLAAARESLALEKSFVHALNGLHAGDIETLKGERDEARAEAAALRALLLDCEMLETSDGKVHLRSDIKAAIEARKEGS